ncbi:MAG: tyrosine protein phosphatase [Pseudomonadota bacterium]
MPHLVVSPLSGLAETAKAHEAREMITLLSAPATLVPPPEIRPGRHLFIDINDISAKAEGLRAPEVHHIEEIVAFAERWDRSSPLLVHCWMGISRSTAAAYIIALALNRQADEMGHALMLRRRAPSATPNARMIALADSLLERDGRMINAIKRIGRGAEASEGKPFVLPLDG